MHIINSSQTNMSASYHKRVDEESVTMRKNSTPPPVKFKNLNLSNGKDSESELLRTNPKLYMLAKLLEAQTGKKIDFTNLDSGLSQNIDAPIFDYYHKSYEKNSMTFSSTGTVTLEDGSEISYSLNIAWAKEFEVENSFSIQNGKIFTDPLVVSFGADEPLVGDTFAFNLSNSVKNLNFTSQTGGYLVYDKNSDGVVNDGTELFGPTTGSGFLELAKYDQDKNGWIDEGDEIFKQLKIWVVTNEEGTLFSLKEAGIGAISLKSSQINYIAKDSIDNSFAHYKNASVALKEDGTAIGVFEVDVAG